MRKEVFVGPLAADVDSLKPWSMTKQLGYCFVGHPGECPDNRTEVEIGPGDACRVYALRTTLVIPLMNQGIMLVAVDVVPFGKGYVSADYDSEPVSEEG